MSRTVRVAGIDCGTNSIRLLVADVDVERRTLTDIVRTMEIVRLGQGVDRTGYLAPEALARTLAATRRYAAICREQGVRAVRFVATSATRDAANRDEFSAGVHQAIGVAPEVVSGQEEARLSFTGALTAVSGPGPFLMVDLGGGSTELALGGREVGGPELGGRDLGGRGLGGRDLGGPGLGGTDVGGTDLGGRGLGGPDLGGKGLEAAFSMDVGSVRMTERYMPSDPPTSAEIAAASANIDGWIDRAAGVVDLARAATLVGLAGTVTSVTAFALGLRRYDPAVIDGARLPVDVMLAACDAMVAMTRADRAELGFLPEGRIDVIGGGALVWSRIVRRIVAATTAVGRPIEQTVTSEHDILDGITLSVIDRL